MPSYGELPAGDLIASGLADLDASRCRTPEALLVAAGATRLRAAGVAVPDGAGDPEAPLALYHALQPEHGDAAHGRYLALLRIVVGGQDAGRAACLWHVSVRGRRHGRRDARGLRAGLADGTTSIASRWRR